MHAQAQGLVLTPIFGRMAGSLVHPLAWDSDCFGFRVGRIADARPPEGVLREALEQAKAGGYRVVYWTTRAEPDREQTARAVGGRLADRRRTYLYDLDEVEPNAFRVNHFIQSWPRGEPPAGFYDLALEAGTHSRFLTDPGFGRPNWEKLYRAWIRNSCLRTYAEEVLYIEDFGKPCALLTLGLNRGRPDIGLVAAAPGRQGRGLGADLVHASLVWAVNRDYGGVQVVTQAANEGACRFYERLGFDLETEEFVFHFWLK